MLHVIFTLDYEIHGNGEGCPHALMVEPTERMLRLFEEYGAKLTIMADIGEILKFKEYAAVHGRDSFHYNKIAAQLQDAVRCGHDVQLHIHSSYFNAHHDGKQWAQDWSEYNFAGLEPRRMSAMVRTGKEYLESLLKPIKPDYRCVAFRAANWSVSPSRNVVCALAENDIRIDSSVFKYGKRQGIVTFDYTHAASNTVPWKANAEDICRADNTGALFEFPIYSEARWIGAFLTPVRLYRVLLSRSHKVPRAMPAAHAQTAQTDMSSLSSAGSRRRHVFERHAWKADFNQCTGRQLIRALGRCEKNNPHATRNLPFVLIGHSKLFTRMNEKSLRPFLAYVAANNSRFNFGTFHSFDLEAFGAAAGDTVMHC